MRRLKELALALLGMALSASGAAGAVPWAPFHGHFPIKIVATTGILADICRHAGGDKVTVKSLITGDPHNYKPSPDDLSQLAEADLIVANGLTLEPKLAELFAKLDHKHRLLAVGSRLDSDLLLRSGELQKEYDPHVWLDVTLVQKIAGVVKDALTQMDPADGAVFLSLGSTYAAQLDALQRYTSSVLATIPREQRVLITAHDAFRYFARTYDMNSRGIDGIAAEPRTSPREINVQVELIIAKKIPAIFPETTGSLAHVQSLADAVKAHGGEVKIDGTLYSDALGASGTREGTYVGMIEYDVNTITRALGGIVPPHGFMTLEDIHSASTKPVENTK